MAGTGCSVKMNIVIPMAGLGSRFRDAGFTTPKPLILVRGKPMYAWATDSLPLDVVDRLIFILLESQPEYPQLEQDIRSRYGDHDPVVLGLPAMTRGQSETVMACHELIDNLTPLLIHNADTGFEIGPSWIEDLEASRPDGALLVFESTEPRWSFSREDDAGRVVEVREKVPISSHASTGTYYFARGSDFVCLASQRLDEGSLESGEFYVAPLYNDLISEGGWVKNYPIDRLRCFGTPEDLEQTLREW